MNLLEILIGQVPEAIYFALFLIFTKELKSKRCLFIILMIIEYLLLLNALVFNMWSHILYTILTFITLKVLYKEKAQITDIFTFGIASLSMIITSAVSFFIFQPNIILVSVANRIILFILLFSFKELLPKIQRLYKRLWNRNDEAKNKMKSTTFRSLNLVIFNVMFYIINIGMIVAVAYNKGVM